MSSIYGIMAWLDFGFWILKVLTCQRHMVVSYKNFQEYTIAKLLQVFKKLPIFPHKKVPKENK